MADYSLPRIKESALPEATNVDKVRVLDSTGKSVWVEKEDLPITETQVTGLTAKLAAEEAARIAADATKVSLTGDQTVAGIKTFTSSPIVPDATTDHQATSLGQVSNLIAGEEWYGVEWDTTVKDTACTRIGKAALHQSLPVHSTMRRCLLSDAGVVNYYLNPANSLLLDNGAAADLSGAGGQVMVEAGNFYVKFETEGTKRRVKISLYALAGYTYVPTFYVSAYEAALNRTNLKLSSVVNLTPEYRGGNNNAAYDASSNTLLGKPATNINLTNFRTYARNRGTNWNCNTYNIHKLLYWLFVVEYAELNSQLAYNAALTAEGYKQGGLGAGVTTLNGTKWNTFNAYNPVIPCGHTNSLGNATGVVAYDMPDEYDATTLTVSVPSYRGVENPFGHLWKWTDGVKTLIQSDASGGLSELYVCDDPSSFSSSGTTGYELRGNLPRVNGYVKEVILGEHGEILPLTLGGSATEYFCDYFYTSIPETGTSQRGVLFGGAAAYGANAGLSCATTDYALTSTSANFGSRLCFIL